MKFIIPNNLNTIKNYIVSKKTLIILSVVLGISDYALSKPLYIYVLDMPQVGQILALTFAFIIGFLPKITGQLLARKKWSLSAISIFFGIVLMGFIYVGQYELTNLLADNPLEAILNEGTSIPKKESNRHLIATLLTALLFGIASFISYLYYAEYEAKNPKSAHQFKIAKVFRYLEASLLKLDGHFQRAFNKPIHKAEAIINTRIADCQKSIRDEEKQLAKETIVYRYEMNHLNNTTAQIKNKIHLIFLKKSFFQRFKF